jgi:hypothetical protein
MVDESEMVEWRKHNALGTMLQWWKQTVKMVKAQCHNSESTMLQWWKYNVTMMKAQCYKSLAHIYYGLKQYVMVKTCYFLKLFLRFRTMLQWFRIMVQLLKATLLWFSAILQWHKHNATMV